MRVVTMAFVASMLVGGLAIFSTARSESPADNAAKAKLRIGTFDSRALAVAYVRSEDFKRNLDRLRQQHDEAKAAGDVEKAKQMEAEGKAGQDRLHQQGFSTAPVDNILEQIKDKLPAIAQEAGVDLIVSKWAIAYRAPGAESVDVTGLMVKPFAPNQRTQRIIDDLLKHPPIPLDKLKIDARE